MSICICNPQTAEDLSNLEHYGCPEEICPGCYLGKEHNDPYCQECMDFLERTKDDDLTTPEEPATLSEMTKILYLMQGCPGSGKSVIADFISEAERANERTVAHLSTDDWRFNGEGTYVFDAKDNERYHKACQQACASEMLKGTNVIIIDNTNIQEWQAHPYLVLANIHGYTVQVVSVDASLDLSIKRQKERSEDRRVPPEVIARMYFEMERLLSPPEATHKAWHEAPEQMAEVYKRGWEE